MSRKQHKMLIGGGGGIDADPRNVESTVRLVHRRLR
jgi:hypothetical protein